MRELAAFGDPCPAFCINVLGMGEDGHVASLFPEHAGLADEAGRVAVTDSPEVLPGAHFDVLSTINAAEEVGTHRIRGGKADAVGLLINDPGRWRCPPRVRSKHLPVLEVDEAAGRTSAPGLSR